MQSLRMWTSKIAPFSNWQPSFCLIHELGISFCACEVCEPQTEYGAPLIVCSILLTYILSVFKVFNNTMTFYAPNYTKTCLSNAKYAESMSTIRHITSYQISYTCTNYIFKMSTLISKVFSRSPFRYTNHCT